MSLGIPTQIAAGVLGIGADLVPNTGPEGVPAQWNLEADQS